jgi:hypothetical protein
MTEMAFQQCQNLLACSALRSQDLCMRDGTCLCFHEQFAYVCKALAFLHMHARLGTAHADRWEENQS